MTEPLYRIKGDVNHHLYKRGKIFWVRYEKAGKTPLQHSLDTENITDARLRRDEAIAKYLGTKVRHKGADLVSDKFEAWIELKKMKAPATIASLLVQWNLHLKPYFGEKNLFEITESEWLTYVQWKRSQSISRNGKTHSFKKRKFFNDRKYLSMFLNWCHREGFIDKLPKLPNVDPEVKAGKIYSQDEIDALILHANPDLQLQITMGVTMGMRIGEILSLEWSQINFKTCVIYLPAEKTKIRKERSFIASPVALEALRVKKKDSVGPWVFPSPGSPDKPVGKSGNKTSWGNCKSLADVKGRFHDLRHTFLTHAFKTSTNPALICHYAGLSLEEAQRTYLHFSVEDTRLVAECVRLIL